MRRLIALALVAGALLAAPVIAQNAATDAAPAGQGDAATAAQVPSHLTFVSTTAVTPTADFSSGDFVRIFQRGTKVVVTFSATIASALVPGTCPKTDPQAGAYVYREFNQDMTPTGNEGIIACNVKGDNGGLLVGDSFYFALSGVDDPLLDGWSLSMYDAASWSTLPSPPTSPVAGPLTHKLDCGKGAGDPMIASVNGLIDIAGAYGGPGCCGNSQPSYCQPGPTNSFTTHHNFFDPTTFSVAPCPPSCPLILPVPPNPGHIGLNSMIVTDGTINFLAGTAILGDLVLMRFDTAWNSISSKVLRPHAWLPEGIAYDGGRYYVSFVDSSNCEGTIPCEMNSYLAVFDSAWGVPPVEEVALTSFAKGSGMEAQKPTILLVGDRLYLAYVTDPLNGVTPAQVSVALFRLTPGKQIRRHVARFESAGLQLPYANPSDLVEARCYGIDPWDEATKEIHGGIDLIPQHTDLGPGETRQEGLVAPASGTVYDVRELAKTGKATAFMLTVKINDYWFVGMVLEPQNLDPSIADEQRRRIAVQAGQAVRRGDRIGDLVVTNVHYPHVHFMIYYKDPGQSFDDWLANYLSIPRNQGEALPPTSGPGSPWAPVNLGIPSTLFCPYVYLEPPSRSRLDRILKQSHDGVVCTCICAYGSKNADCGVCSQ